MKTGWSKIRDTLFGDRAFYRAVMLIIVPVIVQNGFSNIVSLLDNLMVGALGDNEMSGVAIATQLVFVYNLIMFGGLSGPSLFSAQFHGAGDVEGVRNTFRIKVMLGEALALIFITVFLAFDRPLINLYLTGEASGADPELVRGAAVTYLRLMVIGLPAWSLSFSYASTMRETGDAFWPMVASVAAVLTNLLGNWLLIFGNLGCPRLGVQGAAIATVVSRYVELAVVAVRCHGHRNNYPFIQGALRTLRVPGKLLGTVARVGSPLLFNETLYSTGLSTRNMVFSFCGLTVVGALSISNTISNLFTVLSFSMGTAVAVMIGQELGAKEFDKARRDIWRLLTFGVIMALVTGGALFFTAHLIPRAYTGVSAEVRDLAAGMLRVCGIALPLHVVSHCSYFALRAGGKTIMTFLFDCGYMWAVSVTMALLTVKVLGLPILPAFAVVTLADVSKTILGIVLIKKGIWVNNITAETAA